MNPENHLRGGSAPTNINKLPFDRILLFTLLLVLGMGSAGQNTPAQAAGYPQKSRTEITIYPDIKWPTKPICVNGKGYITVSTMADKDVILKNGKTDHISAEPMSGISVTATASQSGVLSIEPKSAVSGSDALAEPGQVIFTLTGLKAGITVVTIKTSYQGKTAQEERAVQVLENCKFKVTINSTMKASYPNLTGLILGDTQGEVEADQNSNFMGTASTEWDVNWFSKCFNHGTQVAASPDAIMEGSLSQDGSSLTLHVDFQPFTVSTTSTATCYAPGGSSKTGTLTPPSIDVTLPSTGGGTSKPLSIQWAEVSLQGSSVISVVPIGDKSVSMEIFKKGYFE